MTLWSSSWTVSKVDESKKEKKDGGSRGLFESKSSGSSRGGKSARANQQKGGYFVHERVFSSAEKHPYQEKNWVHRTGEIVNDRGEVRFRQDDLEFPEDWSLTAVNVVSSKYFKGIPGTSQREKSLKQLLDRVAITISAWGLEDGYFENQAEATLFQHELTWLLLNQYTSFNSPVWFNVGVEEQPQCSACFINAVDDRMESILDLVKIEGMLFKFGSGSGVNLSTLRSSRENLSGGGSASGPVSFMRGFDAFAGVIKSGGKTRRAAKMVILNVDHPDIKEFVECKFKEEQKARALLEAGFEGGLDGELYNSLMFQNANNSVRVSDRFMEAVVQDADFNTVEVTTGQISETFRARALLRRIAEVTHACGDPGLQFDDVINSWHTCPNSGRINASNPCSEYMFLDNSACNLSSINLMRFLDDQGRFSHERFRAAVDIMILAQEILVDRASYPTPAIGMNSHKYRPLGLGYANLGALLMTCGLPYDSDQGRALASALTAMMTGEAYHMSARMAERRGPFEGYENNRGPMLQVMKKHRGHLDKINSSLVEPELLAVCHRVWGDALALGEKVGYRNAQATVIAPTGTIGFMMDCDTTGVEPDLALVKYKRLVGGGTMRIVNRSVGRALSRLGYTPDEVAELEAFIEKNGHLEGAALKPEHLVVFDCALVPKGGSRSITYQGHIKMLAAVQPFVSGSISKTVNVPSSAGADEIYNLYVDAWKLGLKAVAVYRDGSKAVQVLSTGDTQSGPAAAKAKRRRLPDERQAITHKFEIAGHEGYITVGMFEDGTPGEIFITMAKQGSTVSGLMDAFATAISLALQHGVPLNTLVDKFSHLRFEPSGFTSNPQIPTAKSVMDYMFRWLEGKFLGPDGQVRSYAGHAASVTNHAPTEPAKAVVAFGGKRSLDDAPLCHHCGDPMTRNGSCYKCETCGETSGCS